MKQFRSNFVQDIKIELERIVENQQENEQVSASQLVEVINRIEERQRFDNDRSAIELKSDDTGKSAFATESGTSPYYVEFNIELRDVDGETQWHDIKRSRWETVEFMTEWINSTDIIDEWEEKGLVEKDLNVNLISREGKKWLREQRQINEDKRRRFEQNKTLLKEA